MVGRDWHAWDRGCRNDEPRNRFVIPYLTAAISRLQPSWVIDVGAGSGYVPQALMKRGKFRETHWLLIDSDTTACDWLRRRFAQCPKVTVIHQAVPPLAQPKRTDDTSILVYLSYSAIEMPARTLGLLARAVEPPAEVILFLPDVTEDVLQAAQYGIDTSRFWKGEELTLPKTDRFTGNSYPFLARRLEVTLAAFLGVAFTVRDVTRYVTTISNHAHIGVTLTKPVQSHGQ